MAIVEADIARVRAETDVLAVFTEHLALRRAGRRYVGLCPFHGEKTPSFQVNVEQGLYHCFGCGASGDVITFVREIEHLDFVGAVERLASKAGITVRHDSERANQDRSQRVRLVAIVRKALEWYHQRLLQAPDAREARAYLRGRGYDSDVVRQFELGWAPESWDALMRDLNLTRSDAIDTGLGLVNRHDRLNDQFRARILFPIFDVNGDPIGFGGRKLPGTEGPKYKNSPETKLYQKSRVLYGLNWAKKGVVDEDRVVVCEGYTDVIAFHRVGVPLAVATCGTSLTEEHVRVLKNFSRRVILAYDADGAGQNAAEQFYEWERRFEMDLAVVSLPDGADPADVARTEPAALRDGVEKAKPFLGFRVDRMLAAADLRTPEGRVRAYETAAGVVAEHPNVLVREQYLRRIADLCGVGSDAVARSLSDPRPQSATPTATGERGSSKDRDYSRRELAQRPGTGTGPNPSSDRGATSNGTSAKRTIGGRATSAAARAAHANHADRAEIEVLAWAVQRPQEVIAWLDPAFLADPVRSRALHVLLEGGDVHGALSLAEGDESVRLTLYEAATAELVNEPEDVVALVVRNTTTRVRAELARRAAEADDATLAAPANELIPWVERLTEPQARQEALNMLVPWLSSWAKQWNTTP